MDIVMIVKTEESYRKCEQKRSRKTLSQKKKKKKILKIFFYSYQSLPCQHFDHDCTVLPLFVCPLLTLILLWKFLIWVFGKGIALDKVLFSTNKYLYFSYFSTKTYVVGTH